MQTRLQQVPIDGGAIPVTFIAPAGAEALPALVIVPSIFGVAEDLVAQMEVLAAAGATAVAMDPFWRVQPGPLPYHDASAAFARLRQTDLQQIMSDLASVLAWVRPQCTGRIVGLGICFGGSFCFRAAARGELDAVVTWHGSRLDEFLDLAAEIRCPMRLHFGDSDPVMPMDRVALVQEAFASRDDVVIVIHQGAGHGFSHQGAAYHEAACRAGLDAAKEMIAFAAGR
jgi:carboxymethylenebutenolidase